MRDVWAICTGLLTLCLVSGVALSTEEAAVGSTSSSGLVYGYGARLGPPYEFAESEDGKTLYLNGLVYYGPGDTPPPEVTVTEGIRAEHELSVRAYEESKKGTTYDERLALLAAAYISSPLITSVRKWTGGLYVRWASSPDEDYVIVLPLEEETPDFDRAAFWEEQISKFWRIVDSGGMVVFGKKYHIVVPANLVPKTVEQIERVRRGTPREGLDTRETALRNTHFLDDLYREHEGPGER